MKSFKEFITEKKDACYRKIMARYGKWSALAGLATAKCRREKGIVRKTKAGLDAKRWKEEGWEDTKTGKPCGSGGKNEYCRPTKRVSRKTPKTKDEMSASELKRKKAEKSRVGMHGASGPKVSPLRRKK
jgi:hypothetical protein